jgi:L-ascorbate metabolism protein UlaG (beta-lactamase superfamily)
VLLELGGVRVLTDPVFGERASPVTFAGPKRFHPTPVSIAQLPPLDAVLVSHDHYDHLCEASIRELSRRDVPFVTSLGVGARLAALGVAPERLTELDWWEEHTLPKSGLCFTAAPAQHFSGRGFGDRNRTLWSSWRIRTDRHSVFFSGDTGLTEEFRDIGQKLGPFDLVMLEIGAYHPSWGDIHLGPENALMAHSWLGSGILMPVHWGTFNLALHAWDEPAETLVQRAERDGVSILTPRLGEGAEPARHELTPPWWRGVARSR